MWWNRMRSACQLGCKSATLPLISRWNSGPRCYHWSIAMTTCLETEERNGQWWLWRQKCSRKRTHSLKTPNTILVNTTQPKSFPAHHFCHNSPSVKFLTQTGIQNMECRYTKHNRQTNDTFQTLVFVLKYAKGEMYGVHFFLKTHRVKRYRLPS